MKLFSLSLSLCKLDQQQSVQIYANPGINSNSPTVDSWNFFLLFLLAPSPLPSFIVSKMEERNGKKRGGGFRLNYLKIVVGVKKMGKREKEVFPTVVQPPTVEYLIPFEPFNLTQLTLEMN